MDADAGGQAERHGDGRCAGPGVVRGGAWGRAAIDLSAVAPVELGELASFRLHAKAQDQGSAGKRRVATLVATARSLEATSVDDALLLFDLLMSTKLLSRVTRTSNKEKLKTFPWAEERRSDDGGGLGDRAGGAALTGRDRRRCWRCWPR